MRDLSPRLPLHNLTNLWYNRSTLLKGGAMAMKRTMVVLGVALAGALMSASAQVSFKHLKSVDISTYFPGGGQQGDLASDVAFDGANLY